MNKDGNTFALMEHSDVRATHAQSNLLSTERENNVFSFRFLKGEQQEDVKNTYI